MIRVPLRNRDVNAMEISSIPVELRLQRIESDPAPFYKNVPVNSPIPTISPGPVKIPAMSSAPDPDYGSIERVKKMIERARSGDVVESLVVKDVLDFDGAQKKPGQFSSLGNPNNGKAPLLIFALLGLGVYMFWDSLKKL